MTPVPRFYHATTWHGLMSALANGCLLTPAGFSAEDQEESKCLAFLQTHGVRCLWFNSQTYGASQFGPYEFGYTASDLVAGKLVSLGEFHGADCFFSGPPLLAEWLAKNLGLEVISPSDFAFQKRDRDHRIDILVPTPVPLSDSFTVSAFSEGLGSVYRDRARILAHLILSKDHQIDGAFPPNELPSVCADLARTLTGSDRRFSSLVAAAVIAASPADVLRDCLAALADSGLKSREVAQVQASAATMGSLDVVVRLIAAEVTGHFNTKVTAREIEAALG